jgi:sarcosine oxidase subunit beta
MMPKTAIVVGGGYFGCSIAYYLAKNQIKTILLEQNEIGSGASGGNFGCVQVQDSEPGLSLELTLEGYQKVQKMEEEFKLDLEYREIGSLLVAENKEEMTFLEEQARLKKKWGLKIDLLEGQDLKKKEPNLATDKIYGASYSKQGHLNGFKLLNAFVAEGKRYGLEVREKTKVQRVLIKEETCQVVELANGEQLYGDFVILATGAWSQEICRPLGLNVPVEHVKAEACVTEQIQPFLFNYFSLASFFTEAHGQEGTATSFCCVQTNSGNILIGETSTPGLMPPEKSGIMNSQEHYLGIYKAIKKFLPTLADLNILRSWTTYSPYTSSCLPVFGESPLNNLILAAGFKSAVVLTPIVGEIVADIVAGRKTRYDLSSFVKQAQLA